MHILNRILVFTAFLLVICSATLGSMTLAFLNHGEAQEKFTEALDQAKDGHRVSATVSAGAAKARRVADATAKQLSVLNKKKRALRLQVVALRAELKAMGKESDALIAAELRSVTRMQGERERLAAFARSGFVRFTVADAGGSSARLFTRRLLGESLGQSVDEQVRGEILGRAQAQVLLSLLQARETSMFSQAKLQDTAGDTGMRLAAAEEEREQVLREYRQTDRRHDAAVRDVRASEEDMAEILRETAEVQDQILRMQGEMAQIEARLRARAERELIQKGLRTAEPGRYREQPGSASFSWPATGPHTAGFRDRGYLSHFGVPHNGIDIAVGQGTDVTAASDGIVFLARDGGARGFSYILIGHQNGYATLYGHLSQFSVSTGQEVRRGQVIGLSGGRPGTHGAGPMTTGAHLHFEVIRNGVHVDPVSVLP